MAASVAGRGALRAPLPLRGACWAPLPLRGCSATMAASAAGRGALRAPLPLRGACGAPLPLRAVGTFLRFVRCGPRWGSHSTTLRKEPTPTPLQSSPATPTPLQRSPTHLPAPPLQPPSPLHSPSTPAQPYALPPLHYGGTLHPFFHSTPTPYLYKCKLSYNYEC